MTRLARKRTKEQLVTLFWLNVDVRSPDECWLWRGYTEQGYAQIFDGERMRPGHELALEWFSGESRPPSLVTCHSCNTPLCVNPHHLRFDTRQSNVDDMMRAGTHNPSHKLSDDAVVIIRERANAGATGRTLSRQYNVSESLVTEIIRGNKRPNVGGPIRTGHGNSKPRGGQNNE